MFLILWRAGVVTGWHSILFAEMAAVCSLHSHLAAALVAQILFSRIHSLLLGIMHRRRPISIIALVCPFAILSAIYSTVLAHAHFLSLKFCSKIEHL